MIHLQNVSLHKDGIALIRDTTLRIAPSEAVCLCGPSGIGKTTLLEVAAGLSKPDAGTVTLGSERLGCAFQDDVLVPWLDALENVLLVMDDGYAHRDEAVHWLTLFGLKPGIRPTKMSGGMRRRLSLARAFASSPDILLLDEPFAFLDDHWQAVTARQVEKKRHDGCCILLVSHQVRHMEAIACRTVTLHDQPLHLVHPPPDM